MKKIWMMIFVFAVLLSTLAIAAVESEADGKNLLNPDAFTLEGNVVRNNSPLTLKIDATYTFSVPTMNYLDDATVIIRDANSMPYLSASVNDLNHASCEERLDIDMYTCTFTVHASSTGVNIEVSGDWVPQYIGHYGFTFFQLEEGETATFYEPFAPKNVSEPVIQGSGTLVLSYDDVLSLDVIIATYFQAYDEIDGDLSDQIIAISDAYSGNESVVGSYPVTLSVSDSSLNTAYFDLVIIIQDTVPPYVVGDEVISVNVDEGLGLETIISQNLSFHDAYDGVITEYSIIYDNYTAQATTLGTHSVTLAIKDSSNNQTEFTFGVAVYDDVSPVISGPSSIDVLMSENISEEAIKALFTVSDNHTEAVDIDVDYVFDAELLNFAQTGTYQLVIFARDASLNETAKIVTISVIDDVAPHLSGPFTYTLSYTKALDIASLKGLLEVSDNHDMLTTADILLHENTHVMTPGTYTTTFKVSDAAMNTTYHTISIIVIDDIAPYFLIDDAIIIDAYAPLNELTIFSAIKHSKNYSDASFHSFKVIDNTYDERAGEGTYTVTVELTNKEGHQEQVELTVIARDVVIEAEHANTVAFVTVASFIVVVACSVVMIKLKSV